MLPHRLFSIVTVAMFGCAGGDSQTGRGVAPPSAKPWTLAIGGRGGDSVAAMAVDGEGDVVITGGFGDDLTLGTGTYTSLGSKDVYLAKLTSGGTVRWSKAFGSEKVDEATALVVDSSGSIYIAGTFLDSIDVGGGALTGIGGSDIFVAKFAPDGTHIWSKAFGGTGLDGDARLTLTAGGGLLLAGVFSDSTIVGDKTLTSAGATDVFLVRLAADGTVMQASSFGGAETESVTTAASTTAGVMVGGGYSGSFKLPNASLTSLGEDDGFLLKFAAQ